MFSCGHPTADDDDDDDGRVTYDSILSFAESQCLVVAHSYYSRFFIMRIRVQSEIPSRNTEGPSNILPLHHTRSSTDRKKQKSLQRNGAKTWIRSRKHDGHQTIDKMKIWQ